MSTDTLPISRLGFLVLFFAVASLAVPVQATASEGTGKNGQEQNGAAQEEQSQDDERPRWLDELPEAPGKLFYAVGRVSFQDAQTRRRAFTQAHAVAQDNLVRRAIDLLRKELHDHLSQLHNAEPEREGLSELIEELSSPLEEVESWMPMTQLIARHIEVEEGEESGEYYLLIAKQMQQLYRTLKRRAERMLNEAEVELTNAEQASFEHSLAVTLGLAEDEEEEEGEDEGDEEEGEDKGPRVRPSSLPAKN